MKHIKFFNNISVSQSDDSGNSRMRSKDWWIGVAGNIISTMMGIVLTIGVAALVDYHKDKKLAREMMFDVINTAEDNIPTCERMDSLVNVELEGIYALLTYHYQLKGDLSKAPKDSLTKYVSMLVSTKKLTFWSSDTEKFFYSAQNMHQFKNPEVYNYFASYVEYDKAVFEKYMGIRDGAKQIWGRVRSWQFSNLYDDGLAKIVEEMIADHSLTDYMAVLQDAHFNHDVINYARFRDNMLLQIGATQEDLEKYRKDNPIVDEDRVTNLNN